MSDNHFHIRLHAWQLQAGPWALLWHAEQVLRASHIVDLTSGCTSGIRRLVDGRISGMQGRCSGHLTKSISHPGARLASAGWSVGAHLAYRAGA